MNPDQHDTSTDSPAFEKAANDKDEDKADGSNGLELDLLEKLVEARLHMKDGADDDNNGIMTDDVAFAKSELAHQKHPQKKVVSPDVPTPPPTNAMVGETKRAVALKLGHDDDGNTYQRSVEPVFQEFQHEHHTLASSKVKHNSGIDIALHSDNDNGDTNTQGHRIIENPQSQPGAYALGGMGGGNVADEAVLEQGQANNPAQHQQQPQGTTRTVSGSAGLAVAMPVDEDDPLSNRNLNLPQAQEVGDRQDQYSGVEVDRDAK